MQKILYVISYQYLSLPIFKRLAEILKDDFENNIVYFKEPFLNQIITPEVVDTNLFEKFILCTSLEIERIEEYIKNKQILHNIFNFIKDIKIYGRKITMQLEEIKPDIIILNTDASFVSRISERYSKKNNIPLILFQPSFIDPSPFNFIKNARKGVLFFIFNIILKIPLFNRQTFWGNEIPNSYTFIWSDRFAKLINNPSRIRVIGNPLINEYLTIDKHYGKILRDKLKIESGKKIITICTEGFGNLIDVESVNAVYREAITSNLNLHFIIKIHPRDDEDYYKNIFLTNGSNNVSVVKNIPLLDLFGFTDIQISVNSYSSFEAILAGIPVILVKRYLLSSPNYFNNEVVLYADNVKELNTSIQLALTEEFKQRFLRQREKFIKEMLGDFNPSNLKNQLKTILGEPKVNGI